MPLPKTLRRLLLVLSVLLITALALMLRLQAVARLPIDYDEDDYLRAAQQYSTAFQTGNWGALTQENYRPEHPPLMKLLYGAAIAPLPPAPEIPDLPTTAPPSSSLPEMHQFVARLASSLAGVMEVLVLSIVSPLAGFLLAVHTWDIKYDSQVYLEALPALTSAIAVLAYAKSKRKWNRWLVLSAVALGLTAASKYLYCVAGIAIVVDWLWTMRRDASRRLTPIVVWGLIALLVFIAADPYLWPDPVNRLKESLFYHIGYSQSAGVQSANFPAWQPLVWLFESVPWHPGVFGVSLDFFISVLAIFGLTRLWRTRRVFALWLVIALGFLLVWNTKWPQYILILSVPLSLSAAEAIHAWVGEPLSNWIERLREARVKGEIATPRDGREARPAKCAGTGVNDNWKETPRALPWLIPGLIALGLITFFPLVFQAAMALTDFSSLSIRDGMNGGVWREVALGLTGQVRPVIIQQGPGGRFEVRVEIRDRGEARIVPIGDSPLSAKDVHYAGPSVLANLVSGAGIDFLVFDVLWTVISIALQLALGFSIALTLNQRGVRFKTWWRTVFILPWAIPEFVGALIWLHVFEPDTGWLSVALHTPLDWRSNPQSAFIVLLIAALWFGFPFMMIAATAALRVIPPEVYDAAAVDGAARWERFRFVTWPLLLPLLAPAIIVRSIFAFNQFYLFYVLRPPFPMLTLASLSFYIFDPSGGGGQFAISAALNVFTVIILLMMIVLFNRWSKASQGVTYV